MSEPTEKTEGSQGPIPPLKTGEGNFSGESNPTGPQVSTAEPTQISPPPAQVEYRPLELPRVLEPLYGLFARFVGPRWAPILWISGTVFLSSASALLSLGWTWALWDSYRPKITVVAGPTFNAKDPFATAFIIQNQSALPIRKISFDSTWIYADDPNQVRNVFRGATRIAKLNSLQEHALINFVSVGPGENQMPPAVDITPTPVGHHSIVLWYDIVYKPSIPEIFVAARNHAERPRATDGFGPRRFEIDAMVDSIWRQCYGHNYTEDQDLLKFLTRRNPEIEVRARGSRIQVGYMPGERSTWRKKYSL